MAANLVVHFEIQATDPQQLVDFYSKLLGWTITQWGDVPYWTVDTGEGAIGNVAGTPGHGINGGLLPRRGPKPELGAPVMGCNLVIGVDYIHGFMGTGTLSFTSTVVPGAFSRADRIRQDVDVVTARISYKFGGPIIAKY